MYIALFRQYYLLLIQDSLSLKLYRRVTHYRVVEDLNMSKPALNI